MQNSQNCWQWNDSAWRSRGQTETVFTSEIYVILTGLNVIRQWRLNELHRRDNRVDQWDDASLLNRTLQVLHCLSRVYNSEPNGEKI